MFWYPCPFFNFLFSTVLIERRREEIERMEKEEQDRIAERKARIDSVLEVGQRSRITGVQHLFSRQRCLVSGGSCDPFRRSKLSD